MMEKKITLPSGDQIDERRKGNSFVPWKMFIWAMGMITLLFLLFAGLHQTLSRTVHATIGNNVEVKTQLSQIQTDIQWIKKELERRR